MKKLIVLLLALSSVLGLQAVNSIEASAGVKKTVFLDEGFEQSALNSGRWQMDCAAESMKLSADEETGHILIAGKNGLNVENYHLGTAEKIEGLEYFQFDFMYSGEWASINFSDTNVFPIADSNDKFANYSEFYGVEMGLMSGGIASFSGATCKIEKSYKFSGSDWYTLRLVKTSATTADVYCALQNVEDMLMDYEFKTTVTLNSDANYSFDSLFIYLSCAAGGSLAIDNYELKSANLNIYENFNDNMILEDIYQYALPGKSYVINSPDSYLSVDQAKAGDSLIYGSMLPVEESVVTELEVLDASFNTSFDGNSSDKLAFVFGMQESKNYLDGSYACLMETDGVSIVQYANNEVIEIAPKVAVRRLSAATGTTIRVVATKAGKVSVYNGDEVILEATIDAENYYAGYLGFVAVEDNTSTVKIDALNITTVSYKIPVTKSVSHNFSNDFFGNEGYEDFIVHDHDGNNMFVKDGKLVWDGLSDGSYFGSAHEYDNFVMDFKLTSIYASGKASDANTTQNGNWLGIDIGKSIKGITSYGSNVMLLIHITPPWNGDYDTWEKAGIDLYADSSSTVDVVEMSKRITYNKSVPAQYFKDIQYDNVSKMESDVLEKDAVCFRLVAEGGTIRLYMKKACELEYTLYYSLYDIETTGYTALCCTGFTYLKMDDFCMSNISDLYYCADTFAPEKITETVTQTIYDKGNVDVNGLDEIQLNKDGTAAEGGCGGFASAAYCVLPLVLAGVCVANKKGKGKEEK